MSLLQLPITPADALAQIIVPALQTLPEPMRSAQAQCILLATALQESGLRTRVQNCGPARGLFQMERNGVLAVMHNLTSADVVFRWCDANNVTYGSTAIYERLAVDDELACVMDRLAFWCDPRPLPEIGDCMGAWNVYERVQRPGKPDYTRWRDSAYPQALKAMQCAG